MKKLSVFLCLISLVLLSCAQVFDGNLFSSVDKAKLSASDLSNKSLTDLRNMMHDESFLIALRSDDNSLAAVTNNLDAQLVAATTNAQKIQICQTYVIIVGLGSKAYYVANNFLTFLSSTISGLGSSSNLNKTLNSVFPSMSTSDRRAAIARLIDVGMRLNLMKSLSTSKDDFYQGLSGADCGVIAQTGVMGAFLYVMYLNSLSTSTTNAAVAVDIDSFMADISLFYYFSADGTFPFTPTKGGAGLTADFATASNAISNTSGGNSNLQYILYLSSYLGH